MSGVNHKNESVFYSPALNIGAPREADAEEGLKGHRLVVQKNGDHIHVRCNRVTKKPHAVMEGRHEAHGCNANAVFMLTEDGEPHAVENEDGTFTIDPADLEKWLGPCIADAV